jgi:hypothetical protein
MNVVDTVVEMNADMKEICQNGVALESGKMVRHLTSWQRHSTDAYVEYNCTVRIMVDMFFNMRNEESTEEIVRVWNTDRRDPFMFHTKGTEEDVCEEPDYSVYRSDNSETDEEENEEENEEEIDPLCSSEDDLPSPECGTPEEEPTPT